MVEGIWWEGPNGWEVSAGKTGSLVTQTVNIAQSYASCVNVQISEGSQTLRRGHPDGKHCSELCQLC